jgi:DNA-directed RNA polymerase subunit RPC12/RpoP
MNYKLISSFDNYLLANMTLGMLQENGINCHLKDEHIVTMDPLLNPAVGGIKILVAESQFERALSIIKEAEDDWLKEISCPNCKSKTVIAEEKTDRPTGLWGKLKNQIAYGQTEVYSKRYRCTTCNHSFTELPPTF